MINLKQKKTRDYSLYFLKRNPFPAIGVPSDVLVTVDRKPVIERFQNVVAELEDSGTGVITVLVGAYGSGKSHLLKSFRQNVNDQLLSRENGTIAVYVKSPGDNFRDFLLGFVEDIGRHLLTHYSEEVVREYIEGNRTRAKDFVRAPDYKSAVESGQYEVGKFLELSRYQDMFREIRASKFPQTPSANLVHAFLTLSHPEHGSIAWRWFLGEGLGSAEEVLAGVDSTIDDSDQAYSIFSDFIVLLMELGIKSMVLLVDELEKITIITAAKSANYQEDLRKLIDDHPRNICYYFAIAPKQWEELTKETTAFIRRLSGNWYELANFDEANTSELIEKYMFPARVENFSSKDARAKFPDCEPSLVPFTKGAVKSIHELSDGSVSSIILICRKLLEYVYDYRDKYQSVTPDLVNFLKEQEKLE